MSVSIHIRKKREVQRIKRCVQKTTTKSTGCMTPDAAAVSKGSLDFPGNLFVSLKSKTLRSTGDPARHKTFLQCTAFSFLNLRERIKRRNDGKKRRPDFFDLTDPHLL